MVASIVITGLAANDPVPGTYLDVLFAQGAASGFSGNYPALLIGNRGTSGTATVDTVVYGPDTPDQMVTEADVIRLFDAGSEVHRMWRKFTSINTATPLYAVAVTESAGTAASTTVVIATTATGSGTHRLWVDDEFVDTSIATGDTATIIGDAIVANVNSLTHWAVTAANSTGTVTLTVKQKGPRGNWHRVRASITSGIATTTTKGAEAFFTSGATADSNVTALTTILATRFYYLVSAANDATQFGALVTQVNTQAAPITGIRQRAFCGSVDTINNTITIATGINGARAEIVWSKASPFTPPELAAHNAAVFSLFELPDQPRLNFCFFGNDAVTQPFWKVPASRDSSNWPTRTDIKSALNNGVTPIGVNLNRTTYLVDRITTRSLNGSNPDYRIRDAHKVSICDFYADDLGAKIASQFSGKVIMNDPVQGQKIPGPNVVFPKVFKMCIDRLTDDYAENDLIQNAAAVKANTVAQRETSPTTMMSARVLLQPADIAKKFGVSIEQVS